MATKWNVEAVQERLSGWSQSVPLKKEHTLFLEKLKADGFEPAVIYDIGACFLQWAKEARRLWPDATLVLFEAMDHAEFLYKAFANDSGRGKILYHMGALGDVDGKEVKFYENPMNPCGNSYYREVGWADAHVHFPVDNYVVKTLQRLDTVVAEYGLPLPDLVKIDVQGSELDILLGGARVIAGAQRLLIEMQHCHYNLDAPLVEETLPVVEALGFFCDAPKFSDNGWDADYSFVRLPKLDKSV